MRIADSLDSISENGTIGFVYVSLGTGLATVMAGFFHIVLATLLPQNEYGYFGFAVSWASTVVCMATLGMDRVLPAAFPKTRNYNLIRESTTITLLLAAIGSLLTLTLIGPYPALLVLPEASFVIVTHTMLAQMSYKRYSIYRPLCRVAQVCASLLLYVGIGSAGLFFGYAVGLAYPMFHFVRQAGHHSLRMPSLRSKIPLIGRSYAYNLSAVISGHLDKVVVGAFIGVSVLSSYYFAYQIFWALSILPTSLLAYLLPENAAGFRRRNIRILGIATSCLLAAGGYLLLPPIVQWLFPIYADSVCILQLLCIALVPTTAASIQLASMFSDGRAGRVVIGNLSASLVHLVCLIPLAAIHVCGLGLAVLVSRICLVAFLWFLNRL